MNHCLILLLLLFCCNGSNKEEGCGREREESSCGCREGRNESRERRNESRENDNCGCGRERSFGSFSMPGGTCGCEEKSN